MGNAPKSQRKRKPSKSLKSRYLRPYASGRVWGIGGLCRECGERVWATRRRRGVVISHIGASGAFSFCASFGRKAVANVA